MIILTIRTDKPDAEIGLFDNDRQLAYETWLAHRELAETIFNKIKAVLTKEDKAWQDIGGIICFKGPGSFTGLRIGLTIGNAFSDGLSIPIVATEGNNWLKDGQNRLQKGESDLLALPYYDSPIYVTLPR
jgi:tRNA threonylcarbamoyladenosine biosynthesis protein TsaB